MQQPRDIFEADIAAEELLVVQDANAPVPFDPMAVEGEVDLFDPAAFGVGAEGGLGARRAAAEQDALGCFHRAIIASRGDRS